MSCRIFLSTFKLHTFVSKNLAVFETWYRNEINSMKVGIVSDGYPQINESFSMASFCFVR